MSGVIDLGIGGEVRVTIFSRRYKAMAKELGKNKKSDEGKKYKVDFRDLDAQDIYLAQSQKEGQSLWTAYEHSQYLLSVEAPAVLNCDSTDCIIYKGMEAWRRKQMYMQYLEALVDTNQSFSLCWD